MGEKVIWFGILFCLTQSAMFSGLNLAFFSISRLRLEAEVRGGNQTAAKILRMRKDANFLLCTILWGNVGINVLLTLLSNSVMVGVVAFLFSTFVITFAGEILPQAYFSRRAFRMASLLSPVLRMYQYILYPVARPSARMLDAWLGPERTEFLREQQLKRVISEHIRSDAAEVDLVEGIGALNFLDIDEIPVVAEGEPVHPDSLISLPVRVDLPLLPEVDNSAADPFLKKINASGMKWVIITDPDGEPQLLLDSDAYLRNVLFRSEPVDGYAFCHRPIIVRDARTPLGEVILQLRRGMDSSSDEVIDQDIVLLWTDDEKRVITGADILGRLLRGIGALAVA
jgi:metal transporter CNNM